MVMTYIKKDDIKREMFLLMSNDYFYKNKSISFVLEKNHIIEQIKQDLDLLKDEILEELEKW